MTNNNFTKWEETIQEAYKDTGRSNLWLAACLMQESGELAEFIIKKDGYRKIYNPQGILSEAGDVLNFLTAILQTHGYTLEDAIENNTKKLRERGWIRT